MTAEKLKRVNEIQIEIIRLENIIYHTKNNWDRGILERMRDKMSFNTSYGASSETITLQQDEVIWLTDYFKIKREQLQNELDGM